MNTSRRSSKVVAKAAPDPESFGELGNEFFANARVRKADRVIREASSTMARRGRPPKAEGEKKEAVSIRLSPKVLAFFRAQGDGWQTRIDEILSSVVDVMESAGPEAGTLGWTDVEPLMTTNFDAIAGTRGDANMITGAGNVLLGHVVAGVHPAGDHRRYYTTFLSNHETAEASCRTLFERMSAIARNAEEAQRDARTGVVRASRSRVSSKGPKTKA